MFKQHFRLLIKCIHQCVVGKSRGTDWVVLAEGVHAFWTDRYLPPGDPDNFNILNCSVTVTDDKGSFGEYDIGDITVHFIL